MRRARSTPSKARRPSITLPLTLTLALTPALTPTPALILTLTLALALALALKPAPGAPAFYKGATAHFLRVGPHTMLTFVFIGLMRRVVDS